MDSKKKYNILIIVGFLLVLVGVSPLLLEGIVPKNPNPLSGQAWYAHLPLLQQYYFSVAYALFLPLPIITIATGIFMWQRSKLDDTKNILLILGILLVLIALGISIVWWIAASGA